MFKELKVILSASIQKLKQGIKNAIGVVSGGERKIKQSADKINQSLNNAFGGDTRTKIDDLNDKINTTKKELIKAQAEVKRYKKELKGLEEGDEGFEILNQGLNRNQKAVDKATTKLKNYNTQLRESKTNLANSRLAAEDNQSALESMSRTLTAVSSAVLLMDDSSESLRNTMKTLNFAFAAANAVVSINNLKLRENQLFLKASAAANALLTKATRTTAGSFSLFKTALSGLGITAAIAGITYLTQKYLEYRKSINSVAERQKNINKIQNEAYASSLEQINIIESLKNIIDDENSSLSQKQSAYERLQELVPSLNGSTLASVTANDKLTTSIQNQVKALKAKAMVEAFGKVIADKQASIIELQSKSLDEQRGYVDKFVDGYKEYFKLFTGTGAADVSLGLVTEKQQKIKDLQEEINSLQVEFNKALEKSINLDKVTADPTAGGDGKSKAAKKSLDQITNLQTKALIAEERIRAEQEKKFLQTEEDKVRATIASEERILAIKRSAILQAATAQNLSAAQVTEALRNLSLEEIKLQNEKSARLQVAANKDTDAEINAYKLSYDQRKDLLEGMLRLEKQAEQEELDSLKTSVENKTTEQENYNSELVKIQLKYLRTRLKILEDYADKDEKIEKQIADTKAKIQKLSNSDTVDNAQKTGVQVSQVISREFARVGRDLANALSDAFSSAFEQTSEMAELDIEILKKQNEDLRYTMQDATKSQLEQLQAKKQLMENEAKIMEQGQSGMDKIQGNMLKSIANFLDALGKGLIAAAFATAKFQELFANPAAALVAGVAAIAAAAYVRSTINKGVSAFADGGIVSGPTLGLVGEYPGASTNPEVIAPLDKLKNMIGGGMSEGGYIAETKVSGRDLALVLSRYEKDRTRG